MLRTILLLALKAVGIGFLATMFMFGIWGLGYRTGRVDERAFGCKEN